MPYGMYMSAEGAQAQSARLEVIANNLANVNTVGFKPEVTSFQARFAEAIQQGIQIPNSAEREDVGGGVSVIDTVTDFSAGNLQETGNDLDLAIIGDGFFQVEAEGEPLLTRAGNFSVDAQNQLVNQAGLPVLDAGGSRISVQPDTPFVVSADGSLVQGESRIPLALVTTQSLGDLVKVGGNLFRPLAEVEPIEEQYREVRANFLELSGSNPTRQMMQMIETQRAFEANVRMVQNHDSMSSSLITRVLQS